MKLIIQKNQVGVVVNGKKSLDEQFEAIGEVGPAVISLGNYILNRFPKIKEVTVSTEISYEPNNNQ